MIIKTLKARILRALKSSLPAPAASASPPPSPTKPARSGVVAHADAFSDDASFFDAQETSPAKNGGGGGCGAGEEEEPIDAWELVDDGRAAPPVVPDPLGEFPARCPPGGEAGAVLYTTTLRGIRKTFEDCNGVRALLENLGVAFQERDVSMDRGLRDELWALLGGEKAVPPRLFVRGRDVGGAAQVLALHEEGRLAELTSSPDGGEKRRTSRGKCGACGGLRFVVCGECDGSRKVFDGERGGRCRGCNENGLVMCTLCS